MLLQEVASLGAVLPQVLAVVEVWLLCARDSKGLVRKKGARSSLCPASTAQPSKGEGTADRLELTEPNSLAVALQVGQRRLRTFRQSTQTGNSQSETSSEQGKCDRAGTACRQDIDSKTSRWRDIRYQYC